MSKEHTSVPLGISTMEVFFEMPSSNSTYLLKDFCLLIIGVVGPVGAGKTSLLQKLAAWYQHQNTFVDGFVAVGIDRPEKNTGAQRYDLHWIATNIQKPFALRSPELQPPYQFNLETQKFAEAWAEELSSRKHIPLIILDEFGQIEAHGKGHIVLWKKIVKTKPDVIVIAIRAGIHEKIEEQISSTFDLIIDAERSDAWDQLRTACVDHDDWSRIGLYGGASGGFETTVGSALHGTEFPLRGMIMSSMQSVLMMYAADGLGKRGRVIWVPFISAGLKAFSPAGKRLRPMLAITIQGFLFGTAIEFLGWNVFSVIIASSLIGAWTAIQGVVLQYLFIGNDFFKAYDSIIRWISDLIHIDAPHIAVVLLVWILFHSAVTASITIAMWKKRQKIPQRLQALLDSGAGIIQFNETRPTLRTALTRGVRDILRPFFWIPIVIVITVLTVSGSSWESSAWIIFRAVTIGIILFSLAQYFQPKKFAAWLHTKGKWGPAFAFRKAFGSSQKK